MSSAAGGSPVPALSLSVLLALSPHSALDPQAVAAARQSTSTTVLPPLHSRGEGWSTGHVLQTLSRVSSTAAAPGRRGSTPLQLQPLSQSAATAPLSPEVFVQTTPVRKTKQLSQSTPTPSRIPVLRKGISATSISQLKAELNESMAEVDASKAVTLVCCLPWFLTNLRIFLRSLFDSLSVSCRANRAVLLAVVDLKSFAITDRMRMMTRMTRRDCMLIAYQIPQQLWQHIKSPRLPTKAHRINLRLTEGVAIKRRPD